MLAAKLMFLLAFKKTEEKNLRSYNDLKEKSAKMIVLAYAELASTDGDYPHDRFFFIK